MIFQWSFKCDEQMKISVAIQGRLTIFFATGDLETLSFDTLRFLVTRRLVLNGNGHKLLQVYYSHSLQ